MAIGVIALGGVVASCTGEARDARKASSSGAAAGTGSDTTRRLATAEFRVDGMTCGGCALATELAVKDLDGVKSADAAYDEDTGEGRCTVEYDPETVSTERIAGAIRSAGFEPSLRSESTDP